MEEKNTFIKIYRSILSWEWYKNQNTKDVFLHLLLRTNYKDVNFEGVVIKRGEIATSYENIANSLNLSIQEVRTAIRHLKSTGEITAKRYPKFQVITITNYNRYQEKPTDSLTIKQQSTNSQITIDQHQVKNIEEINNNINISSSAHAREDADDNINGLFERFWNAYPKQCGYDKARTAFSKLNPDSQLLDTMLKAIAEQKLSRQWQNVQYIPNPATWINGRRWNDKLAMAVPTQRENSKHSYDLDKFESLAVGANIDPYSGGYTDF